MRNPSSQIGGVGILALLLATPPLLAAPPSALLPQAAGAATNASDAPKTVTLITGDRVVVRGKNLETLGIVRAPGREAVRFSTRRLPDAAGRTRHLFVIPDDAIPLLGQDRVDLRLFDVARLIEFGYDDAHRADLPIIVTYSSTGPQTFAAARSVPGTSAKADLPIINGMSLTSAKTEVQTVWAAIASAGAAARGGSAAAAPADAIRKIWLDGLRRPVLDQSVPQIGAPVAWDLGYEGDGVLVAVLDTGIDDTHPDLSDNVIASRNFTVDPDADEIGHGTHVASIIAGSGAAEGGRYRGVAPGALLLSGKVCEGYGCPDSSLIAGMQWAVMEEGAQLVNVSIGGTDEPGSDPLEEAVNTLSAEFGALIVIAAGNSGSDPASIESPGSADLALTVGAVDRADDVAYFSSRGLRVGDSALKPDLTAPGVDIVAARAAGTELGMLVGDQYVAVSGTSMATPHAVGAAALLLEQHPSWGARELKAALIGSARFNPSWGVADQGAGRVDVAAALGTSLIVDPPSASFGLAFWPHEDDAPIERTFQFRNLGASTELSFQVDVSGPDGIRPPPEMFSVSPRTLSLPEGGTASVTLTANTAVAVPDGVYGGRLIASDGGNRSVAVPLAVHREVESYDLTLRHTPREGMPADGFFTLLVGLDQFKFELVDGASRGAQTSIRLPKGRYALESHFFGPEPEPELEFDPTTLLVAPNLELVADRVFELDARLGEPITLPTPSRDAELTGAYLVWQMLTPAGGVVSVTFFGNTSPLYYSATLGTTTPEFLSLLQAEWYEAGAAVPALHSATWLGRERLPEGPLQAITSKKTATVHAEYAASLPSSQPVNEISVTPHVEGLGGGGLFPRVEVLPIRRTEHYFSSVSEVRWINELWMHDEEYTQSIILGWVPRSYPAGRTTTTRWNRPLFSALLPEETILPWISASRAGDVISVQPAMYADADGHAGYVVNEGRTLLYRNGELIAESEFGDGGSFEVPPEAADYRIELDHSQSMFELTTQQHIVWTFASAHVAEGAARLPLLVLRYTPELDERGRAPRGRDFCLPISAQQFGRTRPPRLSEATLDVSYDEGTTWQPARVERDGENWEAWLDHPRRADYVSLRARARDRHGNGVEHTVMRAYALTDPHEPR